MNDQQSRFEFEGNKYLIPPLDNFFKKDQRSITTLMIVFRFCLSVPSLLTVSYFCPSAPKKPKEA